MKTRWTKRRYLPALAVAFLALGLGGCEYDFGKITRCPKGSHLVETGSDTTCAKNTDEKCGKVDSSKTVNCKTEGYAANGYCEDGDCVTTACRAGYNLVDGKCAEEGSVRACGEENINCTAMDGWDNGACQGGQCLATSCKEGFCLQSGTCMNGKSDADACGIQGGTSPCQICSEDKRCITGACAWSECESTVCLHENQTCLNGDTHCGYNCSDCTENALDGICDNEIGRCIVTTCVEGYHLSAKRDGCQLDTANACGSHDKNCASLPGWAKGECIDKICHVTDCTNGYHLLSEENTGIEIEVDRCVEDNALVCGPSKTSCANEQQWAVPGCVEGHCRPLKCSPTFCLKGGECVDGNSNAMCGDEFACQTCAAGEGCYGGKCIAKECDNNTDCLGFRGTIMRCEGEVKCQFSGSCDKEKGYEYSLNHTCKITCVGASNPCGANEECTTENKCECAPGDGGCGESKKCCSSRTKAGTYECLPASNDDFVCP